MAKEKITYAPQIDYFVIGIATVLSDYRLSYFVNQILELNLSKSKDIIFDNKTKKEVSKISIFKTEEKEVGLNYYLMQNKAPDFFLLRALKNFDYLFVIERIDHDEELDMAHFKKQISGINDIQLVYFAKDLPKRSLKTLVKHF